MKIFLSIFLIILISACQSPPYSSALKEAPEHNLQLSELKSADLFQKDMLVRWGGTIASVVQENNQWKITILERKLDASGRPMRESQSDGRFVIELTTEEKPYYHFKIDRAITVLGKLNRVENSELAGKPYTYPVLETIEYKVWRKDGRDYYWRNSSVCFSHSFWRGLSFYPEIWWCNRF